MKYSSFLIVALMAIPSARAEVIIAEPVPASVSAYPGPIQEAHSGASAPWPASSGALISRPATLLLMLLGGVALAALGRGRA